MVPQRYCQNSSYHFPKYGFSRTKYYSRTLPSIRSMGKTSKNFLAKYSNMVRPPYNNRFNTDSAWPSCLLLGVGQKRLVARQKSRRSPPFRVLSRPRKGGPQLRGLIERYTDGKQ